MNLLNTAVELFLNHAGNQGTSLDKSSVASALQNLLPTGDSGELNLAGLVGMLNTPELSSMVSSWLGDGANQAVAPAQLTSVLGGANISQIAQQLGLSPEVISQGLSQVLPQLIDQSSRGGNLLESVLGSGNLEQAASSILGNLFK